MASMKKNPMKTPFMLRWQFYVQVDVLKINLQTST